MMHVPTSKRPLYDANDSIESVLYRTIPQMAQISCCYGKFILNIRLLTFAFCALPFDLLQQLCRAALQYGKFSFS